MIKLSSDSVNGVYIPRLKNDGLLFEYQPYFIHDDRIIYNDSSKRWFSGKLCSIVLIQLQHNIHRRASIL